VLKVDGNQAAPLRREKMSDLDAASAVLCNYLSLTARDLAEIGDFSERFARDLLAGRRPFPRDVQNTLNVLFEDLANIRQVMIEQTATEDPTVYIYRDLEQLRASPVGKIWPNAYLGPYRTAAFEAFQICCSEGRTLNLRFAESPKVSEPMS
jgi:hypothetical protein